MPETGPGQTSEVLGPQLALEAVDDFMEEVPDEVERLPYVSLSSLINKLESLGKELYEIIPQEEIQKMYELQYRKDTLTVEEWNELMDLKASAEEKIKTEIEKLKKEAATGKENKPDTKRLPEVHLSDLTDQVHELGGRTRDILDRTVIDRINSLQSKKDALTDKEWNELMGLKASAEEKMRAWIEEKKKEDEAKKTREGESKDKAENGLIDPEPIPQQPDPNEPEPVPEPDPEPQPDPDEPDNPDDPDEPNEPPQEPPIRQEDRVEAHKMAENMVRAMEEEERNRLIERALDRSGLFGAIFLRQRRINEIDAQRQYRVSPELRDTIEEYCLQLVIGRQITESGNEVFEMMQQYNGGNWFDIDPNTGRFENPLHGDSNTGLWGQLTRSIGLNRDNSRIRGTGPIAGAALAAGARTGLAHTLGGFLGAIGGGAVAGGLLGHFRGRRESTEATNSAVSWLSEINAALKSGEEAEIELACHKVERIFREDDARNEFFNGRTRLEAVQLLDRYREGMRRLAMHRMAREAADIPTNATETERRQAVASLYAQYCEEMAGMEEETLVINDQQVVHRRRIADEGKFQREHGEYANAFAEELGIITADPAHPLNLGYDATTQPPGARREVLIGFNRDTRIRRDNRSRIHRGYIIRGALMGAAAGGIGYYIGGLIHGAIQGPEVQPVDTSDIAGADLYNQAHAELAARGQHWGHFLNQNNMAEQGFTIDRAHDLGFDSLLRNEHCPFTPFGEEIYVGTDQGAALREAVLTWHNDLNLHGMDLNHVANLMNFAGSRADSLPVDVGLGYDFSQEQVQGVIDAIANNGDQAIFNANDILANFGLEHAHDYLADELTREAAEEAARQRIWPGWLYLAGGAMVGAGYGVDVNRRNADVSETERQASNSPISPPPDSPYRAMGYDIKDFYRTPEPEEDNNNNEIARHERVIGNLTNQISELEPFEQGYERQNVSQLRAMLAVPFKQNVNTVDIITADQMEDIVNELVGDPGGLSSLPVENDDIPESIAQKIRQERDNKGYSNSEIIDFVMQASSQNQLEGDDYMKDMFDRDNETRPMYRMRRNAPDEQTARDELDNWLGQWDQSKAEQAFSIWNAYRAKNRINRLREIIDSRREKIEQLRQQT